MLRTALTLAQKDLRLFLRDRTAVLLAFLLPLVLGAVFGTAMGGMGGGGGGGSTPKVALAVEDRDASDTSRALIVALRGADGLDVTEVPDARRLVAGGDRACGLVIPAGYGAGVASGDVPDLALLRDPSQVISQQVVLFQLAPVLLQRQVDALGDGMMGRVLDLIDFPAAGRARADAALRDSYTQIEAVLADLEPAAGADAATPSDAAVAPTAEAGGGAATTTASGFNPLEELPRLLGLASENVAGKDESGLAGSVGASHAFASMAVMMLLFGVVSAGGTLLQERAEGTLTRLQLTPAAGHAVLIGKLLSIAAIALTQLVLLFGFGALAFDVPIFAQPVALVVVSLVWVLLADGIGLTFAVMCRSQKQLEGLSTLVILVMSAVGGAWFPREITPEWFRAVGSVTPVAWAMDAYHGVLWYRKGLFPTAELSGVGPLVLTMLVGAALLIALSFRLYRKRFVLAA
ncbi:MAG: ABC transporter permease [Planctomycetota bacterium]